MPVQSNDFALVIGIDNYPNFRPLNGAINDARDFSDWLLDQESGGGLPSENCKIILSSSDPVRPGHDDIDDELESLWNIVASRPTGELRRFYFYFSGHGFGLESDEVGLCLAKWSTMRRNLALQAEEYVTLIKESGKFSEVIFFLDCCRVRMRNIRGLRPSLGWVKPAEGARNSRSFIGYATQFQDVAYEAEMDMLIDEGDSGVRGYFTTAMLSALRGDAARSEGGVTLNSLKAYLEKETVTLAKKDNYTQIPVIKNDFPENNEVVFGSSSPEKNVIIAFQVGRKGIVRLEDPNADIVKKDHVNTGPWDLKLKKGIHVLRDLETEEEKVIRFTPSKTVQYVEF